MGFKHMTRRALPWALVLAEVFSPAVSSFAAGAAAPPANGDINGRNCDQQLEWTHGLEQSARGFSGQIKEAAKAGNKAEVIRLNKERYLTMADALFARYELQDRCGDTMHHKSAFLPPMYTGMYQGTIRKYESEMREAANRATYYAATPGQCENAMEALGALQFAFQQDYDKLSAPNTSMANDYLRMIKATRDGMVAAGAVIEKCMPQMK